MVLPGSVEGDPKPDSAPSLLLDMSLLEAVGNFEQDEVQSLERVEQILKELKGLGPTGSSEGCCVIC